MLRWEIWYLIDLDDIYVGNCPILTEPCKTPVSHFPMNFAMFIIVQILSKNQCFKNPYNPSGINLLLTNRSKCFQGTMTMETGISDFHKIVATVLKIVYKKQKLKIVDYRNYETVIANLFKEELNVLLII